MKTCTIRIPKSPTAAAPATLQDLQRQPSTAAKTTGHAQQSASTAAMARMWSTWFTPRILPQKAERSQDAGTPPRAWGEEVAEHSLAGGDRNIPTGVGRRSASSASSASSSEHPHGRGEKDEYGLKNAMLHGTSPRAWGEVGVAEVFHEALRNIPTGVGRRHKIRSHLPEPPEHPHGRGEKLQIWSASNSSSGTSPRAWGEDQVEPPQVAAERNIPTGVGRRTRLDSAAGGMAEHPHGRGEKT